MAWAEGGRKKSSRPRHVTSSDARMTGLRRPKRLLLKEVGHTRAEAGVSLRPHSCSTSFQRSFLSMRVY
jgi:hypothetical protein